MRREELAHLLRAAARIADDGDIIVIGSQAILGSYAEDELPEVAWLSVEADLAFLDERSGLKKADKVDGGIGELSQFDLDVLRQRVLELDCVPPAVQRRVRDWLEATARRYA